MVYTAIDKKGLYKTGCYCKKRTKLQKCFIGVGAEVQDGCAFWDKGSPGKHNGAKSVKYFLQTEEYKRIRVGIGKPTEEENVIEYVIGEISDKTLKELEEGINKAVEAVSTILAENVEKAMNEFN